MQSFWKSSPATFSYNILSVAMATTDGATGRQSPAIFRVAKNYQNTHSHSIFHVNFIFGVIFYKKWTEGSQNG